MIYTFECPQCTIKVETEHEYGAQTCGCGHVFFTFPDAEQGTKVDSLPPLVKPNPYAFFKREGE